jgi:hypothetical protein
VRPWQLPDGKLHHGHACSGAGCWLRSTAQKHCPPSVTVQAVTARCAGRNSQNRGQRTCFAAIGWDGASGRGCLTTSPQPARAPPLACNHLAPCLTQRTHTIGLWVAHCLSARVPQNSVFLDRALCSSQWLRHVLNEKQRAARAVARKTEATVRVSRRSVRVARLPSLCSTPACAPAPPSNATVMCRVPPGRRRP